MNAIFKLLGGWVTNSKPNEFTLAVLRLTAYYTLGVFFVMVVFSFFVYSSFTVSIRDRFHNAQIDSPQDVLVYNELTENLLHILILSDLLLLALTVAVSYWLSYKTLTPLALAYEKQKRFVANAAHELRTPLAVMKAGSEMLLGHERSNDQYQKFLRESLEEVDGLIRLSNDLLFLAENNDAHPLHMERISLSQICTKQCANIDPYARMNKVSVHTDIDDNISVDGDSDNLSRLVRNVLKNAVDYNTEGGSITCTLHAQKTQGICLLSIHDTGIGMSPDEAKHVFERFYKADTSRIHQGTSGAGLGLSIVKEIADAHHASVIIKSELSLGTTLEIEFRTIA